MFPAPTVLLIEADPAVRDTLALVLKDAGYAVVGFETGEAALAAVQGGIAASILVTEVCLPGLDGWDLARAVRRLRPVLPILYIPARDEGHSQRVSQSFVLPKPFRLRALAMAVRLLVSPPETYH
jgi:DNA-binding response OmpR family regulator